MLKNALWLFFIAVLVLVLFLPSYSQLQDLKQKNMEYAHKILELTRTNIELRRERRLLENDPVYLEKVARERLGLIGEGEVMYKLVPENAQDAQKKADRDIETRRD